MFASEHYEMNGLYH